MEKIDPQVVTDVELAPDLVSIRTLARNCADGVSCLLEWNAGPRVTAEMGCQFEEQVVEEGYQYRN